MSISTAADHAFGVAGFQGLEVGVEPAGRIGDAQSGFVQDQVGQVPGQRRSAHRAARTVRVSPEGDRSRAGSDRVDHHGDVAELLLDRVAVSIATPPNPRRSIAYVVIADCSCAISGSKIVWSRNEPWTSTMGGPAPRIHTLMGVPSVDRTSMVRSIAIASGSLRRRRCRPRARVAGLTGDVKGNLGWSSGHSAGEQIMAKGRPWALTLYPPR